MTLKELIAALTDDNPRGPVRRERSPMPQAPARYPGQAGALRSQPIPPRSPQFQAALDEASRMRGRRREIEREMGPQPAPAPFFPAEPPPMPAERVTLSSLQGEYPAGGTAADWIAGPPRTPPRGALFVQPERDPEPWRSPVPTERMFAGEAAPRRGMEPASAGALNMQRPAPMGDAPLAEDDLDAHMALALARVQGRLQVSPYELKRAGVRAEMEMPRPRR